MSTDKNKSYCFMCKKSYSRSDGYHFFTFPWKNETLADAWLSNLDLKDKPASLQPTMKSRLCEMHFSPSDIRKNDKRTLLVKGAVPLPVTQTAPSTNMEHDLNHQKALCESLQPETKKPDPLDECDLLEVDLLETSKTLETRDVPCDSNDTTVVEEVCVERSVNNLTSHVFAKARSSETSTANAETGPRKRQKLSPEFCKPLPEDSPQMLRRKAAYLYHAFQKTFQKKKSAQQSVRRLKKQIEDLERLLRHAMQNNE